MRALIIETVQRVLASVWNVGVFTAVAALVVISTLAAAPGCGGGGSYDSSYSEPTPSPESAALRSACRNIKLHDTLAKKVSIASTRVDDIAGDPYRCIVTLEAQQVIDRTIYFKWEKYDSSGTLVGTEGESLQEMTWGDKVEKDVMFAEKTTTNIKTAKDH